MDSPPRLRASRFVVAVAGSVALVLSAPFIGYVRAWIRSQFPGQFVRIVGGLIAVLGLAAIGIALARIRERRAVRYGAIAGALVCAVGYSAVSAKSGNALGSSRFKKCSARGAMSSRLSRKGGR